MTINTNYAMEITIDLLLRHITTLMDNCQELFLVTHTGFEPMLTA